MSEKIDLGKLSEKVIGLEREAIEARKAKQAEMAKKVAAMLTAGYLNVDRMHEVDVIIEEMRSESLAIDEAEMGIGLLKKYQEEYYGRENIFDEVSESGRPIGYLRLKEIFPYLLAGIRALNTEEAKKYAFYITRNLQSVGGGADEQRISDWCENCTGINIADLEDELKKIMARDSRCVNVEEVRDIALTTSQQQRDDGLRVAVAGQTPYTQTLS